MATDAERAQSGLAVRKKVLGAAGVEKTLAGVDDFTREWQEVVNRTCWGEAWTRTGIDLKTRSLITVAILATLGKMQEIQGHTRGAFNNGATPEDIQEVLYHVAVYVGIPAAFDAFRTLQPVVAEHRDAKK
ncbi:MAG: carboxymuconolactone decarboxylase family protein [Chloroflexota bacterium]|nr:carboxymuconolactone decarboxylase family protein [Chloroflexota bacterium]